ncbi:MAG: ferrous iron transport protein A [Clostridia bacterium]|nr:ferrous iron transport protein A [Clostridia bacterium]
MKLNELKRLCDLPLNQTAVVVRLKGGKICGRINDLGIVEGCELTPVFNAPFGDPVAYSVKHTLIALRQKDSRHIYVRCKDDI